MLRGEGPGDADGPNADGPGAAAEIDREHVDATVRIRPAAADRAQLDAEITVIYSSVRDGSKSARKRVERAVRDVRERRLETLAASVGDDAVSLEPLTIEAENRSSDADMARHVAALLLPILMLVMTALGEYPQRITFSDFTSDSFLWTSEGSQDGGETWVAYMRVNAKRIQ